MINIAPTPMYMTNSFAPPTLGQGAKTYAGGCINSNAGETVRCMANTSANFSAPWRGAPSLTIYGRCGPSLRVGRDAHTPETAEKCCPAADVQHFHWAKETASISAGRACQRASKLSANKVLRMSTGNVCTPAWSSSGSVSSRIF